MNKIVMLITGTPCVGKTTVSRYLAVELNATYLNLTDLAKKHSLIQGEDKERKTIIIDEEKMRKKIEEIIRETENSYVIVDGHYASKVVPKTHVTQIIVLRRNPIELRSFMEKKGFSGAKLWENLASEILDVCLVEALSEHNNEKVCEVDATGKSTRDVATEILAIKDKHKKCRVGNIDWIGLLEEKNILKEYLRF